MKLECINCNKQVEAILVTGDVIYPHRPDLKNRSFYQCPYCNEYVGCHPNTDKPLGCIPSKKLRRARIRAHNKLDILWKSGKYKRADIYKVLSEHFGYKYHNGNTKTVEECLEAIKVLEDNYK